MSLNETDRLLPEAHHVECHYVLIIKEHLASTWSDWFEGLTVTYTPTGETQLSGFLPDQSALHGLLARIRDLNLTLISVNRMPIALPSEETIENEPSMGKMEE
jgi:hypothetical protein